MMKYTPEQDNLLKLIWPYVKPETVVEIFGAIGVSTNKNTLGKRANLLGARHASENSNYALSAISDLAKDGSIYSVASRIIDENKTVNSFERKDEIRSLKAQLRDAQHDSYYAKKNKEILESLMVHSIVTSPDWAIMPISKGLHHAIPILTISDWHYGETVDPVLVRGVNEYNCEIAEKRLKNTVLGAVKMCTKYTTGYRFDGICVNFAGDMLTGYIHEELRRSADIRILPAVLRAADHLANAIEMLKEHFGRVMVKAVVGNHGRIDMKPQFKSAVEDNYEWILHKIIQKKFAGDENVSYDVSDSTEIVYQVYDHRALVTHGDCIKGGNNAMVGVEPAILRGLIKLRKQFYTLGESYKFDMAFMGHFHWQMQLIGMYTWMNGSIKGYDEFANAHRMEYQDPMQSLIYAIPERKIGRQETIYCDTER